MTTESPSRDSGSGYDHFQVGPRTSNPTKHTPPNLSGRKKTTGSFLFLLRNDRNSEKNLPRTLL